MSVRQKFVWVHALLLAACGPGLVGVDHDDGTSSAETTDAPPSTSDVSTSDDTSTPDDTSTSSADTGLEFVAVPDVNTSVVPCEPFAQDCPHGAACCTSYCNIELGPEQCDALPGTACVSFFEQGLAPLEYELVGVCIVP